MTGCPCGRPSPSAAICTGCEHDLAMVLVTAARLAPDLEDAIARQLRRGSGNSHGGSETPLIVDLAAMAVADHLHRTLMAWLIAVSPAVRADGTMADAALRLLRLLPVIRLQPWAGEMLAAVTVAVSRAMAAVDRQPGMLPAGPCDGCGAMVYAESQAAIARCLCGVTMTGIGARRERMVAAADVLGSPAEIAATLAAMGRRVTEVNIRVWASRGRLEKRSGGLYRLSDVLAMVAERDVKAS